MLETLRAYARERLDETGDPDRWRRHHAEHYAGFAEQAGSGLEGPDEHVWRARVRAELDNVRAAIGWALRVLAHHRRAARPPHRCRARVRGRQRHDPRGRRLDRACRPRVHETTPGRRTAILGTAAIQAIFVGDHERARTLALDALRHGLPPDCPGPRPRLLRPGELRVEPRSAGRGAPRHPTRAARRGGRRIRHVHAQHLPFQCSRCSRRTAATSRPLVRRPTRHCGSRGRSAILPLRRRRCGRQGGRWSAPIPPRRSLPSRATSRSPEAVGGAPISGGPSAT